MPLRKRRHKYLLGLAAMLAGLGILIVALPAWFPWALRPLAAREGVVYSRYESRGYVHFALSEVACTNGIVVVSAGRVEAIVPTVWLWRVLVAKSGPADPFVQVADWHLRFVPSGKTGQGSSAFESSRKVNRALLWLSSWMPFADVTNGALHFGTNTVKVSTLHWSRGSVDAELLSPRNAASILFQARRSGSSGYGVNIRSVPLRFDSVVDLSIGATGASVQSTTYWWSNRVDARAQFGPTGLLPQTASVSAEQLQVPSEAIGIPAYRELRGSLSGKWENGVFGVEMHAEAEAPVGGGGLPPLTLDLRARGDGESVTIETATLVSPLLKARLSRELTVYSSGQVLHQPAHLALEADLSRQNWLELRGRLNGEADLSPGAGRFPEVRFHLAGSDLSYQSLRTRRYEAQGRFEWPQLEVFDATAYMEDGSRGSASGKLDVENRSVEVAEVAVSGPVLRRWLPAGYGYDTFSLTGRVHGPFNALAHTGQIEITNAVTPFLKPLDASAHWSGTALNLDAVQLRLANAATSLSMQGAAKLSAQRAGFELRRLELETNGQPCLSLVGSARISATRATGADSWQIQTSSLGLSGQGGRVWFAGEVDWPRQGRLGLRLERLSSRVITGLILPGVPDFDLADANAVADWTNNRPAQFSFAASGTFAPPASLGASSRIAVDMAVAGNEGGVLVSNLVLTCGTAAVARVEGTLPFTLSPGSGTNPLAVYKKGQLRLRATAEPRSFLWDELVHRTGVGLREPHLEAEITGTWEAPLGHVTAGASGVILLNQGTRPLPALEGLQLDLELSPHSVRLTNGQACVQGQPMSFTAELPLGREVWSNLLSGKLPDLDKARGRLRIEEARLAAFEPLFPTLLASQGNLDLDVTLQPGRNLHGRLSLTDARTQSLGATGPVRDIFVNVEFRDRLIVLERASASIGAAKLSLAGQADLGDMEWLKNVLPSFHLSLRGLNIPLARQPEYVIRGDLRLELIHTNGAPPIVNGSATLHDSYFLRDLNDLIPGQMASPERRPPYFSIQDPLLADWRLAVDVTGSKFLKLRGPLFNGEVNANAKLQGTLKEPILLGDATIDSGFVRFPFASLRVQQGLVTLTSQDPYHPQLVVHASSKQFGYDIHMNVSGPVDTPIVQFTSNPPLTSEQILLMVSAGELPQGNFNLTSQQRAQTVALFLGRDMLAKMGVGDDAEQRLSIRSGEQFSEQGRPTYRVEYRLDDNWSIIGEYDRFGDFNADLKWRVYSK